MKKYIISCVVLTAMITGAGSGQSQLLDKISLHGFGSWAGGMTNNENRYFLWNEDGNVEHVEAALNIQAELYDKVAVYVQTSFDRTWLGTETDLDYAFAEWSFSDLLTFRAGKVNAPFMLYSEVYDVRIIRPFFNLPLGIYHDMGAEAYKGIGLTGTFSPHQGWQIQYDIYGGTMTQHPNRRISNYTWLDEDEEREWYFFEIPDQSVEKMIGGRLFISPPLEGMRFGFSAYTGEQKYYESDSLTEYEEYWTSDELFTRWINLFFLDYQLNTLMIPGSCAVSTCGLFKMIPTISPIRSMLKRRIGSPNTGRLLFAMNTIRLRTFLCRASLTTLIRSGNIKK
ncbi:MAG: hypothetical protein D3905_07820 [Candidatus Electrothrix sp. AS4_5]|nr:hypothetical protein [Candidatus Electrothrix gigas]